MPMQRERYPANWEEISRSIRERDAWRCAFCGASQGQPHPLTGSRVVLTVAHLGTDLPDGSSGDKHNKQDVRPENLAALCQRCHLRLDIDEHAQNSRVTRTKKRIAQAAAAGQMPMWEEGEV